MEAQMAKEGAGYDVAGFHQREPSGVFISGVHAFRKRRRDAFALHTGVGMNGFDDANALAFMADVV